MVHRTKENVLVLGATGVIGQPLVRNLRTFGIPVRAATRLPVPYAVNYPKLDVVLFDYHDPTTYGRAVDGVTKAVIMPLGGETEPQQTVIPLIEAARQAGVYHIVLISHFDAALNPSSGLLAVENYLKNSGIIFTILRPNWLMQMFNFGILWSIIRKTGTIFLPAGLARTSFIDAEDVAAAATIALTEEGHLDQTYTLTGNEAVSYDEVALMLSNACRRPIRYVPAESEPFAETMVQAGWPVEQVYAFVRRFDLVRDGYTAEVDPQLADILGRQPGRFIDFAYDHADIWQSRRFLE